MVNKIVQIISLFLIFAMQEHTAHAHNIPMRVDATLHTSSHTPDTNVTKSDAKITEIINKYLAAYTNTGWGINRNFYVEWLKIDDPSRTITINFNEAFAQQPFTQAKVDEIINDIHKLLPKEYKDLTLHVLAQDIPLINLVPSTTANTPNNAPLTWGNNVYKGQPWVENTSIPAETRQRALNNRHFAIWQSHGRYYNINNGAWLWQRPQLWCTTEDLLTQSFVTPFIVPMLENAGANIFMPRERDWQKHEVIIDNDTSVISQGVYKETNGQHAWKNAGKGFAHAKKVYSEADNPFIHGTSRMASTQSDVGNLSRITWAPKFDESGKYAVYVSYKSESSSVPDAQYTVTHQGISTHFSVNQRMGGSTWVYIGTYYFDKNDLKNNNVTLTNESKYQGIVTADAVRFGGGMGNIARSKTKTSKATLSGLPRFLEGSRYNLQWSGIPDTIYHNFDDDYKDDYTSRPNVVNYLAAGSIYNPNDTGLCVPIEMSLAVHSDAGYTTNDNKIGTLGIFTSDKYGETTFPTGVSRLTTRTLCEMMMGQMCDDIEAIYGKWNRREIYNKSYAETRTPIVPATIIETLSHQNFADMKLAHDPTFKFTLSRAIYKSIARYNAYMHEIKNVVIQPLPVKEVSAVANAEEKSITLSWSATKDELESSAKPKGYIIYTRIGERGYDNGVYIEKTSYKFANVDNKLYRFKICAYNEGGTSLPSEEVCARCGDKGQPSILIVNAFQRLSGPQTYETTTECGFDMLRDPGVAYLATPEYCGPQRAFQKKNIGGEDSNSLGYSSTEYVGTIMAGNTFNYPTLHAEAILTQNDCRYSISSTSRDAFEEGHVSPKSYALLDIIMGAQREDGYSKRSYKTFTSTMKRILRKYAKNGGNILLSGAYIGTDMRSKDDMQFTSEVFHYTSTGEAMADSMMLVYANHNRTMELSMRPNEKVFHTRYTSILTADDEAKTTWYYDNNFTPAAIYYNGRYKAACFGFPIEMIADDQTRTNLICSEINKLLTQ